MAKIYNSYWETPVWMTREDVATFVPDMKPDHVQSLVNYMCGPKPVPSHVNKRKFYDQPIKEWLEIFWENHKILPVVKLEMVKNRLHKLYPECEQFTFEWKSMDMSHDGMILRQPGKYPTIKAKKKSSNLEILISTTHDEWKNLVLNTILQ